MLRLLGFVTLFLPPLTVFIIEVAQFASRATLPVAAIALIYPLGIMTLVAYSLAYRPDPSGKDRYLGFSKGARLATIAVFFGSVLVAFFPVLSGQPLLGIGLLSVSLGSIWIPSAYAAGPYGYLLCHDEKQVSEEELRGTRHGGIATLFLALFLGRRELLSHRRPDTIYIVLLAIFYLMGWIYVSLAGGFPYTAIGLAMLPLVPFSANRVLAKTLTTNERARVSDMLSAKE